MFFAQHPLLATHLTVKSNIPLRSCKSDHTNHDRPLPAAPPLSSSTLINLFPKYTKSFPLSYMTSLLQRMFLPKMTHRIPSLILFKCLFKYHLSSEVFLTNFHHLILHHHPSFLCFSAQYLPLPPIVYKIICIIPTLHFPSCTTKESFQLFHSLLCFQHVQQCLTHLKVLIKMF